MAWRNLRDELCEVLADTVYSRVPLAMHPGQSVHIENGGRTTFRGRSLRATCRQCHKAFRRKKFGMKAVFCTKVCWNRHWRSTHDSPFLQEIRTARAASRRCVCGSPARKPKRGTGPLPKYCSDHCGQRARNGLLPSRSRADRFQVRLCACGKPAHPPHRTGVVPRYCSGVCRQRQYAHAKRCGDCIFKGATTCTRARPTAKPWANITAWRGKPKLAAEHLDIARQMRSEGATLKAIATELRVSTTHAHRITRGLASYRVKWLEYNGERRSLRELAALAGISYAALQQRLRRGLTVERAVAKPWRQRRSPETRAAEGRRQ